MTFLARPWSLRRTLAAVVGVMLAASVVTACGSDDESDGGGSSSGGDGEFPVTVESAHGDVTMEKAPERVVAVTPQAADLLVEIGVQPVVFGGLQEGDGESEYKDQPWLDGRFEGELDPDLLDGEYNASVEYIATLSPDLIVGNSWNISEEAFNKLSEVAPTYSGLESDRATDWDVQIEALGELTGHSEEASAAIAGMEDEFAKARDELPGLQGNTYNGASFDSAGGQFRFGARSFLEDLGLEPAESQGVQTSNEQNLALENMSELDGDVLIIGVWQSDDAQDILEADPRFENLPANNGGVVLWSDIEWANASNAPTPNSLRWLLDLVVPQLKDSELNQ
ncbi:MAG: ABC transporter substrate-binding protein [Candidatus Corynebacterium faecigallinarum]